jgi:predicted ATPase
MSQSTFAETNGKEAVQGITGISVRGYKSLSEECSIEIRPLTILAGANSSGKSSIMQPLLLMKQTLEATYDPGALLLNGPNVQFTFAEQLLSRISKEENSHTLAIKIELDHEKTLKNIFKKNSGQSIEIDTEEISMENGMPLVVSSKMSPDELLSLSKTILERQSQFELMKGFIQFFQGEKAELKIHRERCFLNFDYSYKREESQLNLYNSLPYISLFKQEIRHFIHVPGLRNNPERTYPVTAFGREFPGRFEDYVASVVNHWKTIEDQRVEDLEKALMTLGLTSRIDARQVNDVQIELRVNRLPASNDISDMVSIADVGIGVSQVLPVLVALLVAEPGQLVYLEQPEIHLHPRAQVGLAEVLANAANRGVRVVLETHSELLLLAIQSLVAEGSLSSEKVKLHWFTRRKDGVTKVSSAELDEAGAFGDWPEDFGDVSMKLESRYLDAAESRLWKRSHGG